MLAFPKIRRILGHVKTEGFYGCEAKLHKHRKSKIFEGYDFRGLSNLFLNISVFIKMYKVKF